MRYLRLYMYFLRFSFSKSFEFRLDFFFRIIMDVVFYIVNFSFFKIIYGHTETLAGWSFDQVTVFLAAFFMIDALNMTFFSNNMWHIPYLINKGDLDYYLLRPVNARFFLTTREFAANSFVNLIIAIGFWVWAIQNLQQPPSWSQLTVHVVLVLNGLFLYHFLQMSTFIPTFWTQAPHGLSSLFYQSVHLMERPHKIFSGWLRVTIMTVLPFALMASVPSQMLFEGIDWELVLRSFMITIILWYVTGVFWRWGLRSYSSASS